MSLLFVSSTITAQNSIGITTGFNIATISQNGIDNNEFLGIDYATFGTLGINYSRELDANWSVVTGLNYARKGAITNIGKDFELYGYALDIGANVVHRMDYIEIPLMLQYNFKSDKSRITPYFFFGPQLSYETGYEMGFKAHILVDINLYNYDVNIADGTFNRWDVSGIGGAGLAFPLGQGHLDFSASYQYGFTDLLDNPVLDFNLKHRNIRFGAGYYYNL